MHATIRCYNHIAMPTDGIRRAGRRLGSVLGRTPGFIGYVLVETSSGSFATVSIFETMADLEAGDRVLVAWEAEHMAEPRLEPVGMTTGQILVQCGL
jgi:hypothetical protein